MAVVTQLSHHPSGLLMVHCCSCTWQTEFMVH